MIAVCTDNMDEEHPNRVPDYVEEEDDVVRKKSTRRKKHRNKGLYKDCRIYDILILKNAQYDIKYENIYKIFRKVKRTY